MWCPDLPITPRMFANQQSRVLLLFNPRMEGEGLVLSGGGGAFAPYIYVQHGQFCINIDRRSCVHMSNVYSPLPPCSLILSPTTVSGNLAKKNGK